MKLIDFAYKFTHSLKVLSATGKQPAYLFKKGSSVSSMQIVQALKKYIPKLDLIIDVGANQGQFALAMGSQYKDAAIHSFEPLPDIFPKLVYNTKKHSNITVHNFALGDLEGEINFFKNEHSHASSILKVSSFQKNVLPETSNESIIKVSIKKLDTFLGDSIVKTAGTILLKLDVQGYEKNVLTGAKESLKRINYVLLEVSFVAMYENEPLFNEMNEFMNSLGFSLLAPVGFLQARNLQIVQLDMLYKRYEDFN